MKSGGRRFDPLRGVESRSSPHGGFGSTCCRGSDGPAIRLAPCRCDGIARPRTQCVLAASSSTVIRAFALLAVAILVFGPVSASASAATPERGVVSGKAVPCSGPMYVPIARLSVFHGKVLVASGRFRTGSEFQFSLPPGRFVITTAKSTPAPKAQGYAQGLPTTPADGATPPRRRLRREWGTPAVPVDIPQRELSSDGTYGTPPGATLADLGRCRMGSRYGNMFAPFRPGFTD